MQPDWENSLERWRNAGLIDEATANKIRFFEQSNTPKMRWPVMVAIAFGSLMLGAGVLLFVAAHWDAMSPAARFELVLLMIAVFHGAGAWVSRSSENFAIALHGIGTAALGAGIYLGGQIFNFAADWAGGALLWAIGAWIGYALRRDWVQFALAAVLTPLWLTGEWSRAFPRAANNEIQLLLEGLLLAAITYFSARTRDGDSTLRKALTWIGGIVLLPVATMLASDIFRQQSGKALNTSDWIGYAIAISLPLVLAVCLRRRDAWMNVVAAVWVIILGIVGGAQGVMVYIWCSIGAAAMIAWGVRESRDERVNMGMAGFALTLLFFYFSKVMDKLGRSESLVGLGLLFLAGGWMLERLRRRWVAQARGGR
jgi:uncharacterized membrane protein